MRDFVRGIVSSCLVGSLWTFSGLASADIPDPANYVPTAEPIRISSDEAPRIDGDLSDPVWQRATQLTDFYTVEPALGEATEDTIVYLAYDDEALYVAIRAYDRNPERILTRIMERDGDVWRDDMVRFYIDPFNTGLSGFGFDVNANGARLDRIIQRGRAPIDEWNTIWDSAGQVDEEGWTAEFTIPFRSISFDPESTEGWGLLITREVSHANQELRWASIDPGVSSFDFRSPGRLTGIRDIDQGLGLDVELQGKLVASRDWEQPRDDDIVIEPSANIYYKLTPSLTGLLTLNADFSDTPLDSREINTGRFSIFLPETRDFFLQDASLFEFAGSTFSAYQNGRPFFSRRIGIVDGQQVDLKAGLKLSGELSGVEFGVLSAQMGSTDSLDSQNLSVARASVDVLDNSRLGFIATNGDPRGLTDNTLVGTDFIYLDRSFLGGGLMQATAFYMRTTSDDVEDDSFGISFAYPNDRWDWDILLQEIGEDYRPALGFVNRPGTREMRANWHRRYRPSGSWINYWQIGTAHRYVGDLDGNLETRKTSIKFEANTSDTDLYKFELFENFEAVSVPFSLPNSIVVPAGDYHNDGISGSLRSSFTRSYGTESSFTVQDYYGGNRVNVELEGSLRPSPYWNLKVSYEHDQISVPNGDVTVRVFGLEGVINFSPDISVATEAQYDNISEGLSVFSRLRWEVRPETELFVSMGHGAIVQYEDFPRDFESVQTQLVVRFGNRFQF
ncbi:carbohydrate binding family 9 domain-containing protein [Ponticaulis sp.]|uniref:carbohydrate binding family 9 domain-containing protein n=1 Tax=Ponticaulis sp. TaxID=2020902 RepID=UPI000B7628C4|nr:carbohydrate binding family 9 domain-containing protein [Ponticaulis sp.]MAI91440.1 hypothetical protein [Ponticaulis sp.]OUX97797.1 MAG: hypothetical protein CBB65_13440 [Hyphomonadaceae bacterium TMED5]